MSTTTGGRPLVHVGGGGDRRAIYHEEQAALREALELGTATTHADRTLPAVVVTVSAASIVVHADAPNYRQASFGRTCPRRSAMSAGTPRPAAVWPLRWPGRRRSALSESLWQRAAAQGAAAAAGPRRHAAPHLQSGTVSFGRCVDPPNVKTRFTCCGLVICITVVVF